jgi:hypothetical protein
VTTSEGAAVAPPSVFEMVRDGLPVVGVVVVEQLLADGSPGVGVDEQAVLRIEVAEGGRGLARVTAKSLEAVAPGARSPRVRVHEEPVPELGVQAQPGLLAGELKLV